MRDVDLARRDKSAGAGIAPARFGVVFISRMQCPAFIKAARAQLQKIGRHAEPFLRSFFTNPTTPSGKNSVTPINSAPRKYSQNSG